MPNEGIIPSEGSKSVCTYTLLSNGTALSSTYHVLSITVSKEVNRIPTATIIIADGEASKQTFAISNTADFEPGKEIEIKAGYSSKEDTIFKGIVIKHGIKVRKSSSVLVIECKDKAVKMTVTCKNKYFKEVKDSDVIEQLIDGYGLEKDVAATDLSHKELVQYNTTDWDFLMCRVDVNGLLCMPNDGKITVAKPDFSAASVLTVQYGSTVHDLDAEIDARFQFSGVKATGWSQSDQNVETVDAADPSVPETGNLSASTLANITGTDEFKLIHSGTMVEQELQQWANAKLLKQRMAKIRGRITTDGTPAVTPGKMIKIDGVGERFTGNIYVTAVRQEIQKGTWQTSMQFGLEPEWFAQSYEVEQPLAGALLPAIQGLQIGIVTKLESDPDGEHRIQVKVPVIDAADDGIWSRVCTLDAGKNRGTFYLPEIGDEVIVGFINNDPRHAVILGMLNSSKNPAALTAADKNDEKGYTSRSGMKMIFNDDKKSIDIETPAGNKFTISEDEKSMKMEDQNGNKFTMDQDGITIDSYKDLTIKAKKELNVSGQNATVKADSQATFKGGSAAEFSSGGSTALKGSTVQIN
ncbi:type VI secretion system tip protein VgrG [Mucilaginibacter sp. KACC 22773]|uniref:type VI secretion system tip protein VgrG n=1 Tax=Mucilaginibacter sp. KACC 22773 TaxID=3025671 RepID=UPI00236683F3|nr:type VI secretion system tip protein VgrG [Mucilaginibacter sp. KACC 22773]WDF77610.1 type VI secretion system tip protein VgrG [Mucilaginibacter sp. KACC 22773]